MGCLPAVGLGWWQSLRYSIPRSQARASSLACLTGIAWPGTKGAPRCSSTPMPCFRCRNTASRHRRSIPAGASAKGIAGASPPRLHQCGLAPQCGARAPARQAGGGSGASYTTRPWAQIPVKSRPTERAATVKQNVSGSGIESHCVIESLSHGCVLHNSHDGGLGSKLACDDSYYCYNILKYSWRHWPCFCFCRPRALDGGGATHSAAANS